MARGTDGRPSNSFSTPVWHGMFCFRDLLRELQRRCGLRPTRHVSTREQLAIFLRIARTGQGNLEMQERFQRSGDTISKAFHRILNMLVSKEFYEVYVKLPPADETPKEIHDDRRFYPFFAKCRGAVDGSLLDALYLQLIWHDTGVERVVSPQIYLLHAAFLFCFVICSADGKGVLLIAGFSTMHGGQIFS